MPLSAPPADVPRLYVGGLLPTIATPALLGLLKAFGTPSHVERHSDRPFAHISLQPHDAASIDKCITMLNNTEWNGARLKVLRAREHYALRLQREWKEAELIDEEQDENETEIMPIKFRWNGKHTRFNFTDVYDVQVEDEGYATDQTFEMEVEEERVKNVANSVPQTGSKPAVGISATLESTMQLFGLDDSSVDIMQIGEPIEEVRSTKRRKKTTQAVQVDEGPVDLDREKETALSVLAHMFSESERSAAKDGAKYKRLGLFRKLQAVQALANGQAENVNAKRAIGKSMKGKCAQGILKLNRAQAQKAMSDDKPHNDRRAGLYKKLMPHS